jgi:putative ABC transport system permease protein
MRKYKTQSFTAILGLAFGLACFVLALYWMRYETSFDTFYPDSAHIYRIFSVEKQSGRVSEFVPGILEQKLREHFPAAEASTGFVIEELSHYTDEIPHIQLRTLMTDSAFFRVFPQVVLSGNVRQPMPTLHNIVITETVAVRLFGNVENAIGQQIRCTMLSFLFGPYTVTAVVQDPPRNTNLPFDAVLFSEMQTVPYMHEAAQWEYFNQQMYVKFHSRANTAEIAEQLRDFTSRLDVNDNIELRMMPISDIRHRFASDLPFTLNFIRLFVVFGILLMFSALFNFLNLHIDLYRQRIRELRLRTVHGATGNQLIAQMMFELACTIFLALALACCFVALARPAFAGLLDITIGTSQLFHLFAVCGIWVTVLVLFIGFIPFWRLSHLALRNLATTGQPLMRRVAVTVQLAVSVVFIVAALVVMMQIRFVNNKDLGFDRSGIIQMSGPFMTMYIHGDALIRELSAIPQIENITATTFEPRHSPQTMNSEVEWLGMSPHDSPVFQTLDVDSRFAETFRLTMLHGRWWNEGEQRQIVLNEEAVRVMGLSEPIGAIIRKPPNRVDLSSGVAPMQEYEVVGVVNDFHTLSLRGRIQPTILRPAQETIILYARAVPGQELEAIRRINAILPDIDPSMVDVRVITLDELYDRLNHSEQAGFQMFSIIAVVCLLISLFGIYAIAVTSTQRRRKEIAIRKVFGAKVSEIVRMFFREYALQVIIAGVVALPLAYLIMTRWLEGYAYRTNIPWWLLAGVITAVIAVVLLTVLGQVLRAANRNPAEVVKGG